jgi:hypothetical protein
MEVPSAAFAMHYGDSCALTHSFFKRESGSLEGFHPVPTASYKVRRTMNIRNAVIGALFIAGTAMPVKSEADATGYGICLGLCAIRTYEYAAANGADAAAHFGAGCTAGCVIHAYIY